jgi:CheY-like chemotaxis protein
VAVTGYGSRNDKARAAEVGFDRFLVKPADPTVLADLIAKWQAEGGLNGRPAASPAEARTVRPG